jgi:hypothetical protein
MGMIKPNKLVNKRVIGVLHFQGGMKMGMIKPNKLVNKRVIGVLHFQGG